MYAPRGPEVIYAARRPCARVTAFSDPRGTRHGRFPALVVAAGVLLAAGTAGAGVVSDRVAAVAATAAGGHYRDGGVCLPRCADDVAGARAAWASRLSATCTMPP